MVIGGEVYHAGMWSKQALERLLRDGLPPTPRNYYVYYEYVSGGNPALTAAFDKTVSGEKMTQSRCDELYYNFVVFDEDREFLKNADDIIEKEVNKVLDLLAASAKGTGQFGDNLDDFRGKLGVVSSTDALREAVRKIAEETQLVTAQNKRLQEELAETSTQLTIVRSDFDRVHHEAQIDSLTEVGNRNFFDREIVRVLAEIREKNSTASLLMVDIDHFKKFNDRHGHLIGDQVLRLVARTLVENLKGRDIIARYGGEEFVIILPDTKLSDAALVANHLRDSLASKKVTKRGTNEVLGTVTISVGAAEYADDEDGEAFIARADEAMYEAKQTGRNKVVCAGVSPVQGTSLTDP